MIPIHPGYQPKRLESWAPSAAQRSLAMQASIVAELADAANADLHWCLEPEHRDAAMVAALQSVVDRIGKELQQSGSPRLRELADQARRALADVREASFARPTRLG